MNKDSLGILTAQDMDYINVMNAITDLYIMHGADEEVKKRLEDIEYYLYKYAHPDGFKERLNQWDKELDKLDDLLV